MKFVTSSINKISKRTHQNHRFQSLETFPKVWVPGKTEMLLINWTEWHRPNFRWWRENRLLTQRESHLHAINYWLNPVSLTVAAVTASVCKLLMLSKITGNSAPNSGHYLLITDKITAYQFVKTWGGVSSFFFFNAQSLSKPPFLILIKYLLLKNNSLSGCCSINLSFFI